MISKEFVIAIKLYSQPQWRIAMQANLDPSTLSKIIIGCIDVTQDDRRLQRVCEVINFPIDRAVKINSIT